MNPARKAAARYVYLKRASSRVRVLWLLCIRPGISMAGAPGLMRLAAPVARRCLLKEATVFRGQAAATATVDLLQSPKTRDLPQNNPSRADDGRETPAGLAPQLGHPRCKGSRIRTTFTPAVPSGGASAARGVDGCGLARPDSVGVAMVMDVTLVAAMCPSCPTCPLFGQLKIAAVSNFPSGRWFSCQLTSIRPCCPLLSYIRKSRINAVGGIASHSDLAYRCLAKLRVIGCGRRTMTRVTCIPPRVSSWR
jgi:hypothetical protein